MFKYLDHYTIFRPLAKQGMAGSVLPAMTAWSHSMGLLISLHVELAVFCLTTKKYISSSSLHSCKFSRETALECITRLIVDATYKYSVDNNMNNMRIINNSLLELSSYSNKILTRYSVYGAQEV